MAESPPNLRYADGGHDCSDCCGFKEQSQTCSMFSDFPVGPDLVCNAWKPEDNAAISDDGANS